MERLTEEKQIGPWASLKDHAEAIPGAFANYDCLMAHMTAVTRLKAYEDTGLTPEQCANAKNIIESAFNDDTSKAERIRGLLQADKDGRLVVLPPEDYYWKIRGDLMLGIIAANCRAAEKAGKAEEAKQDG